MTEPNQEALAKHDLTGALARVPQGAIEILGEEEVARIEDLARLTSGLLEFSKLPNPFELYAGYTDRVVTPETTAAIDEIKSIGIRREDSGDPEVSQIARRNAKTLRAAAREHFSFLTKNYIAADENLQPIVNQTLALEEKQPEELADILPVQYEALETVAKGLANTASFEDLAKILNAEYQASFLDAKTVGIRSRPDAIETFTQINDSGIEATRLKSQKLIDELGETHRKLSSAAAKQGRRNWRVMRAHRSIHSIDADEDRAEALAEKYQALLDQGSDTHEILTVTAFDAVQYPSIDLLQAMVSLKRKFLESHIGSQAFKDSVLDEQARQNAVDAEKYIADKALQTELLLRQARVKLNEQDRRSLHELKDTAVSRVLLRLGQQIIEAVEDPYENIDADPDFRRACRAARDIIAGGGRVNHPEAKRLAKELHDLRFGKDRDTFLEPEESGLVIGIAANQAQTLLDIIDRLAAARAGEADAQVEKLRREQPEQHFALSTYNIGASIEKLKSLLDDQNSRQTLLNALRDPAAARRVRTTIETLWHQRVLGETDYQEHQEVHVPLRPMAVLPPRPEVIKPVDEPEPEVEEPAEPEPQPDPESEPEEEYEEPEQTEEELQIIDEAMTDIAEQLEWTVFPPGATLQDIRTSLERNPRLDLTRVNWERIEHLIYLADTFEGKIYRSADVKLGTKLPYLVSEITVNGRRFAIAECPQIGNATYIVDDSAGGIVWEDLMRLHKNEARDLGAKQVVHPVEQGHLKRIVRQVNSMLVVKTISGR